MNNRWSYAYAFLTGGAAVALSLIGKQFLMPYYGATIYLPAVITVIGILAWPSGCIVGNRIILGPSVKRYSALLIVAGYWIIQAPLILKPVLMILDPTGIRIAVAAAACMLYGIPIFILGMINTLSFRVTQIQNDNNKRNLLLWFFNTVVGGTAFGTAVLFLFNEYTVTLIPLTVIAAIMSVTATTILFSEKLRKTIATVIVLLLLGVLSSMMTSVEPHQAGKGLLAHIQTANADHRVLETERGRIYLMNGDIRAVVDTFGWVSAMPDVAAMNIPKYFFGKPGRVLIIGLGGASLVKNYFYDGWSVDVVETDTTTISIARQYFGLLSQEANLFTVDPKRFLNTTQQRYDVMIIDAIGGTFVPSSLLTTEFFGLFTTHLQPESYVLVNTVSIGWKSPMVSAVAATLNEHFVHVLALPNVEPPNLPGNVVVLASNHPLELFREIERDYHDPDYRWSPSYQKNHAWDNHFIPDVKSGRILRDHLNPGLFWIDQYNVALRKELHETFSRTTLAW